MFAIIALVLALFAWFEHAIKAANVPAWIDSYALAVLSLAALAAHQFWPTLRRPPQG